MIVCVIILALYFWAYFASVKSIGSSLLVNDAAAILAGISLVTAFVSYLWAPKKYIAWASLSAFGLLTALSATLVLTTGGTSSPFIALWMLVSIFAGVFGAYGLVPLFIAITAYLLLEFVGGNLTRSAILTVVLTGELPLVVSYLIWHSKPTEDTSSEKAYRELATELSEVAGKSEVVINAITDGVIALNSKGIIQLINPAAQQIIGWGKQDALSLDYKSVLKLVDKQDAELTPANDPVSQALATNKEVATDELSLITNSGKKLLVSVIVSPVAQIGSGVIIVFRDITKEKTEERAQAEFISTASHEMRTPVASIEGYLGLALNPQTATVDEKARDFISKAQQSAQHLGRLFQDLLDVTKADDGRLKNDPKVVDVVAFTHEIMQGLESKAKEKGLRFIFKPLPDNNTDDEKSGERRLNPVYYANVDNDHLREVISNVIENAIKYTLKGDVVVDIGGDTEHVVISVADSGIGIPKEDMSHLFQKFYRVDNSQTREIGGTGLGLYLCRRLTEAMNGRIWAESEFKKGSTFYIELPRIDHEEATRLIEAASIQEEKEAANTPAAPETPALQMPMPSAPSAPATPSPSPEAPPLPPPTQPQAPPVTQDMAAPLVPSPQLSGPVAYTPATSPTQPGVHIHPNVPLTSIEQNPEGYIRARPDGVPIPSRRQQ